MELLREAGESAAREGTNILVEPLNRYETHLANTLADGAAICAAADHPNVNIMADFFHMSIEEADIAASIRGAAQYVKHVHLADSNRTEPGTGHTEFRSGFAALQEIGFERLHGVGVRHYRRSGGVVTRHGGLLEELHDVARQIVNVRSSRRYMHNLDRK